MTLQLFISLASLLVSVCGLAAALWYHCKRDHERFGELLADVKLLKKRNRRTYMTWFDMQNRCYDEKDPGWKLDRALTDPVR